VGQPKRTVRFSSITIYHKYSI